MNFQAEAESSFDPIAGFVALTGREPFRWQRRLLEEYLAKGHTPDAVDVPTGLGKTMVMALWLIARAQGSPLPRRLVYVVDRRAVVDQATEEAEKLRAALEGEAKHFGALDEATRTRARLAAAETKKRLGLSDKRQLPISTLRGQHADNLEWLKDPHLPAIIVGTVDMIGSRLLFEGYGVSRRMRPMHAGLLGADSWILLDEAHLVPPFEALLRSVAVFNSVAPVPAFRATALSATGRNAAQRAFALEERDIQGDKRAFKRLTASKKLTLREAPKGELAKAMAFCAIEMAKGANRRIIVFANSRKTAQAISSLIEKGAPNASTPVLLVGARRVPDAMHALMSCGLTVKQAAGLTGELNAESKLGALNGGRVLGYGTGDGSLASGIAQWHPDRWHEMTNWAVSQKLDPRKLSTQYKMVCEEAKLHYGHVLQAMEHAQNVVELERAAQPYEGNKSGPGRAAALLGARKALKAVGSNFGSPRPKLGKPSPKPEISKALDSVSNSHHGGRS